MRSDARRLDGDPAPRGGADDVPTGWNIDLEPPDRLGNGSADIVVGSQADGRVAAYDMGLQRWVWKVSPLGDDLQDINVSVDTSEGQGASGSIFVTGAAGIGKSSLVDAFIDSLVLRRHATEVWVARGASVELHGAREGYMPVLAAVEQLAHRPEGPGLLERMRRLRITASLQATLRAEYGEEARRRRQRAGRRMRVDMMLPPFPASLKKRANPRRPPCALQVLFLKYFMPHARPDVAIFYIPSPQTARSVLDCAGPPAL